VQASSCLRNVLQENADCILAGSHLESLPRYSCRRACYASGHDECGETQTESSVTRRTQYDRDCWNPGAQSLGFARRSVRLVISIVFCRRICSGTSRHAVMRGIGVPLRRLVLITCSHTLFRLWVYSIQSHAQPRAQYEYFFLICKVLFRRDFSSFFLGKKLISFIKVIYIIVHNY